MSAGTMRHAAGSSAHERSAHAPRHEAPRPWMTIHVVRPDHGAASAVWSIHDRLVRNIDPLAVDAHAVVSVPGVPIGIINPLRVGAVAARALAAMQALIPAVQLRVLMIVGASVTDRRNRQNDSEQNERRMTK